MKKLVVYVLFIGILFSCEKSDDSTPAPTELNGKWELQDASCFCFFSEDFEFSGHKIDFNTDAGTLIVENSTETSFIATTGSYDFEVQSNKIVINSSWEFTYELDVDTLVLSLVDDPEISDDEITLTYNKVN